MCLADSYESDLHQLKFARNITSQITMRVFNNKNSLSLVV